MLIFAVVVIIALVLGCIFLVRWSGQQAIQNLEKLILKADRSTDKDDQYALETYCKTCNISEAKCYQIGKAMYARMAQTGDQFAIEMMKIYNTVDMKHVQQCKFLTRAAELGDTDAMVRLGDKYSSATNENGDEFELFGLEGFGYDAEKSFAWYQKAAQLGNSKAMGRVAGAYLCGEGVVEDENRAFTYARECADKGSADCCFFLFDHYCNPGINPQIELYYIDRVEAEKRLESVIRRRDRKTFSEAAKRLGQLYGDMYFYNLPPDALSDRRKAAYCFTLAYIAGYQEDFLKRKISETGYHISDTKWKEWCEDGRNLRYCPYDWLTYQRDRRY